LNTFTYPNSDERTSASNSGLAKVAVQCIAESFVVNQTLVLCIDICGKNRQLLVAENRYKQGNHNITN